MSCNGFLTPGQKCLERTVQIPCVNPGCTESALGGEILQMPNAEWAKIAAAA